MLKFIPIKSGSSGNCYIIEGEGNHKIILELGIPWNIIQRFLNFKTSEIDFALGSHRHFDHLAPNTIKNALKAGIEIGIGLEAAESLGVVGHHRVKILEPDKKYVFNKWTILPFSLKHDVPTMGFLIQHYNERLLFIADTAYMRNRFTGVTIIAVECNHSSDILADGITRGNVATSLGRRVRRNHMSLDTVKKMLLANDLSVCREIFLLHLSDTNSDEKQMILEIQEATGIPVYAAI